MRISDWSSDVCSSDLMIQMNPLHEQIRRHAHVDDDAFQVSRRVLHNHWLNNCGNCSLRDLLSTWTMRMSVGRRVRKIGRASCRERVCPYVWISVVDVSLQKKNTNELEVYEEDK